MPQRSSTRPEDQAREIIDQALERAGWIVQDEDQLNLGAGRGVAAREFRMASGHGFADYLLFVDRRAVGCLEAKKGGHTLTGVEAQARKYSEGLPDDLDAPVRPLPFRYLSNGEEIRFTNGLDPEPRSRPLYAPHRPETLADWLDADPLHRWVAAVHPRRQDEIRQHREPYDPRPSSLRERLSCLPGGEISGLWEPQARAIQGIEASLAADRPRALVQMATGSGKSRTAVVSIYRMIKFVGARRVLFLVDRTDLGRQAEGEFADYRTYDDNKRFTDLYNVQRLESNSIFDSTKVVITTIQRLYSMLKGEPELDPELEEHSEFADDADAAPIQPETLAYQKAIPPEFFDVLVIDECHRSIYTLWRQVLDYFDAFLIGLTATPAQHTFGFFNQNVVMEFTHAEAVAAGINVDFEVYEIRTQITEQGSRIQAGPGIVVPYRERNTRAVRWNRPDEDIAYTADQLDRGVVAKDQIRLIVRTFKDKITREIFPERNIVPKTLIFAKDDSHAEDIVEILREEFGKGNEFCTKITYKSTGKKPEELIKDFRLSYNPRIAVTVDMVSTGTDIRPLEVVMFLRAVKSRVLYEQMKGRGTRVVNKSELRAVTPDAAAKTHFILIDCVGLAASEMHDTRPLEQNKSISFKVLLKDLAKGTTDEKKIRSLAGRLARLDRQLELEDREKIRDLAEGLGLPEIGLGLVRALDPDRQVERARALHELADDAAPDDKQLRRAAREMIQQAAAPLADNPKLRNLLVELKKKVDQLIDEISQDVLLKAEFSESEEAKALRTVRSFEEYLRDHKDEIDALQFFYSQPYSRRLRYDDIKELADAIREPPRSWTPEKLWQAYEKVKAARVRGASGERLLTDLVSLVRFTLKQDEELVPYSETVRERFRGWLAQQENGGRSFGEEQMRWLEMMRDHVAESLEIEMGDFELTPFVEAGGMARAQRVFGEEWPGILGEVNEVLAA